MYDNRKHRLDREYGERGYETVVLFWIEAQAHIQYGIQYTFRLYIRFDIHGIMWTNACCMHNDGTANGIFGYESDKNNILVDVCLMLGHSVSHICIPTLLIWIYHFGFYHEHHESSIKIFFFISTAPSSNEIYSISSFSRISLYTKPQIAFYNFSFG